MHATIVDRVSVHRGWLSIAETQRRFQTAPGWEKIIADIDNSQMGNTPVLLGAEHERRCGEKGFPWR